MSDARPPGGSTPSSPPKTPATAPGPASKRVLTAARAAPLPEEKRALKERLKGEASNAALNAAAVVKESVAGFRGADRYFKFKVGIIAAWIALSAASLVVACPGGAMFANNNLHARLVVSKDAFTSIIMVVNESEKPWRDVTLVVNGRYRAAEGQVMPHDSVTVTPKQLLGPHNKLAPPDLTPRSIELRTARGHTMLMENGVQQ